MRTAALLLAALITVSVQGCANPRNEPAKAGTGEKREPHGDNVMAPGAG